mmetsp:Transcript_15145/g.42964  ORF Transcript_15145/g.42964 Transcript_15145/m.42964 type:complete len:226 (+) Transcript_15145:1453-2130(+)
MSAALVAEDSDGRLLLPVRGSALGFSAASSPPGWEPLAASDDAGLRGLSGLFVPAGGCFTRLAGNDGVMLAGAVKGGSESRILAVAKECKLAAAAGVAARVMVVGAGAGGVAAAAAAATSSTGAGVAAAEKAGSVVTGAGAEVVAAGSDEVPPAVVILSVEDVLGGLVAVPSARLGSLESVESTRREGSQACSIYARAAGSSCQSNFSATVSSLRVLRFFFFLIS